eukprot:SAG31_NODE_4847_length_2907_cov_1.834402_3_plen_554_part_00
MVALCNCSCGSVGQITHGDKASTYGRPWDLTRGVTGSKIALNLRVIPDGVFISGDLDGHLITMMMNSTVVNLGRNIFVSLYKELEEDTITLQSIDASFICDDCTVRHSEQHQVEIRRPGIPPDDAFLNGVIMSAPCDQPDSGFDACVVELALEGTRIANITVMDTDRSDGDEYSVEIVEQELDGLFRLSSALTNRLEVMWLEVGAARVPAFLNQEFYTVTLRVQDNVWSDHFFMKTFVVKVLAHPDAISLSALGVPETASGGTVVADISANDPDTATTDLSYTVQSEHFEIIGDQLVVASNLPDLASQAFFEITVIAADPGGLSFEQEFRLYSIDINECALDDPPCGLPNMQCVNRIGGYACVCNGGYEAQIDGSGSVTSCTDIDECDDDPCGQAGFVDCLNLVGSFNCTDINECEDGNNGGCGSAEHAQCANVYGGPPTCSDVCECAVTDACSATASCTNYQMKPHVCSSISAVGVDDSAIAVESGIEAGSTVTIRISGNVDSQLEYYAIRKVDRATDQSEKLWEKVDIVPANQDDCLMPECASLSLTPLVD